MLETVNAFPGPRTQRQLRRYKGKTSSRRCGLSPSSHQAATFLHVYSHHCFTTHKLQPPRSSHRTEAEARAGSSGSGLAVRSAAPPRCARPLLAPAEKRHPGGGEGRRVGKVGEKSCKVLPFLFDRLLLLLFSLHLTCPLWAPDARLLFPSTDAISAPFGAERRNNLDSAARLFVLVSLQPPLLSDNAASPALT